MKFYKEKGEIFMNTKKILILSSLITISAIFSIAQAANFTQAYMVLKNDYSTNYGSAMPMKAPITINYDICDHNDYDKCKNFTTTLEPGESKAMHFDMSNVGRGPSYQFDAKTISDGQVTQNTQGQCYFFTDNKPNGRVLMITYSGNKDLPFACLGGY